MSESKCPFHNVTKPDDVQVETFTSEKDCQLKVFRLHPGGVRLKKADHKLNGDMFKTQQTSDAVKWCGPMLHANKLGYWMTAPLDIDIMYKGNGEWEQRIHRDYHPTEKLVIRNNLRPEDKFRDQTRTRISFGDAEPCTVQMWTGCIFRTPPGWCMHIRNPINFPEAYQRPFHIQEGIIETDWMNYDIWVNVKFHRVGEWASFRRNMWPPLAQFVPVRRSSYEGDWSRPSDKILTPEDAECVEVWDGWQDYNFRKWKEKGEKEPLTYHKTRKPSVAKMRDEGLIP